MWTFWGGKIHLYFKPHFLVVAYVKKLGKGLFSVSLFWLESPFPPPALEPASSEFWGIVETRRDIQICGMNNY